MRMQGDSNEKDAIIYKYTTLVEDMRKELEEARVELLRSEEDRMKVQEQNVMARGSLRRKDEETLKVDAENTRLVAVLSPNSNTF